MTDKKPEAIVEKVVKNKPVVKTADNITKKSAAIKTKEKRSTSKVALIALILALIALAIISFFTFIFNEQKEAFQLELQTIVNQSTNQRLATEKMETKRLLIQQQTLIEERLNAMNQFNKNESQKVIEQLQRTVDQLSATKPNDWLIHEAQYLVRVAVRTLWLEKNSKAAIGLLSDADSRLKELNDPSFLPVRQDIREDIAALQLLPQVNTDDILLSLMALTPQVDKLSLTLDHILEVETSEETLILTDNVSDWRTNLSRTWKRFADDFITIRSHSNKVEPLLSEAQKQNISMNIKLKLQQAQWAASNVKAKIYQQTLADIQALMSQYFNMEASGNQHFYQSIELLKNQTVFVEQPTELKALASIQKAIDKKSFVGFETLDELVSQDENVDKEVELEVAEPEITKEQKEDKDIIDSDSSLVPAVKDAI